MRQLGQVAVAKRIGVGSLVLAAATGEASTACSTSRLWGLGTSTGPMWVRWELPRLYSLRSLYSWVLPSFQFCTGR